MNNEQDYVLGTHDEEIQRLGLQHRVWRPRMLEAWTAAGITEGSRVVDVGAGPGYASIDLAEVVGPPGQVLAIERSARFASFTRAECQRRGLTNVRVWEADLTSDLRLPSDFDAVWCRWVASFVTDVPRLVQHIAAALRPGGRAIFHEYVHYSTWRTIPRLPSVEAFVAEVMASWRDAGGEPDVATTLLPELCASSFELVDATPIVFAVDPTHYVWQWPRAFIVSNVKRLVESGRVTEAWGAQVQQDFVAFEQLPNARMLTPMVLQIIARRR